MNAISLKSLCGAIAFAALSGCVSTTPHLDSRFGHAVNAAKAQQTLNPDASRNPDPVAGIDGAPAKESIDRYHETFKAPPRTFNIIIDTGGDAR